MSELFVIRGRLQEVYAKYSMFIDKGLQFALAFFTFFVINQNVGFMKAVTSIAVIFVLALVCAFLPTTLTVMISTGLVLLHMYKFSLGVFIVTAIIYMLMFICYFKFAPKYGAVILIVPIAFHFNVPYIIPIACGLLGGPSLIVPTIFGTIIYFMMNYIKTSASVITGVEELLPQMSMFVEQLIENKELWITAVAFAVCILVVYTIRTFAVDHAWFIAIVAGGIVNIVVLATGAIMFNTKISYGALFFGGVIAIIFGFILELFIFAVDYSRTERLQYEDDDYYYYVKAIPKISIAVPRKTVKNISENQEEEVVSPERNNIKKKGKEKSKEKRKAPAGENNRKPTKQGKRKNSKKVRRTDPDAVLLEQSLKKDLDL